MQLRRYRNFCERDNYVTRESKIRAKACNVRTNWKSFEPLANIRPRVWTCIDYFEILVHHCPMHSFVMHMFDLFYNRTSWFSGRTHALLSFRCTVHVWRACKAPCSVLLTKLHHLVYSVCFFVFLLPAAYTSPSKREKNNAPFCPSWLMTTHLKVKQSDR